MFKKLLMIVLIAAVCTSCGYKKRKGYFYDNHRFNYVRLAKFKYEGDYKINHPYTFTEPQMRIILQHVEISQRSAFTSNEKMKEIFDAYSIAKLTPPLVEAFKAVQPNQRVAFAFMIKDPKIIIRNDRLSDGWMWVENGKLHIQFDKLFVKVTGDTDKMGYGAQRQVATARGLRVSLDLFDGQEYGASTKELVVDIEVFAKLADIEQAKVKELAEKGVPKSDVKVKIEKEKSAKQRLIELETLRKERLISEKEYQLKKKEIMNQL